MKTAAIYPPMTPAEKAGVEAATRQWAAEGLGPLILSETLYDHCVAQGIDVENLRPNRPIPRTI